MIRAIGGISSPWSPLRVAAAVDALVVGADDLGDRPVDADVAQQLGADLGMAADRRASRVGELAAALHDAVGEDELADVVQQPGRVRELLVALDIPTCARCRARTRRPPRSGARRASRARRACG